MHKRPEHRKETFQTLNKLIFRHVILSYSIRKAPLKKPAFIHIPKLLRKHGKGQIISEGNCGILNFPKKTNKKI